MVDAHAHAADEEGGGGADLVGDHHGHLGKRKLERDGARFGQGGVGSGEGVEALFHLGEHHLERPSLRHGAHGFGRGMGHRDDDAEVGVGGFEGEQSLAIDRNEAADLAVPRAGKHAEDGRIRRQPMPRPEGRAVAAIDTRLDGRVADIGRGNVVFGEERCLERQQSHDVVDAPPKLLGAAWAPSPELRRDVMHDGNARAAQLMRKPHGEARGVDRDNGVGREPARFRRRLIDAPDEARQMRQHLGQTHHRKIAHGIEALEALRLALRTADAGKTGAACRLARQSRHQPSGEVVAGGLAGDDEDQRLTPVHVRSQNSGVAPGRKRRGLAMPRALLVDQLPDNAVRDDKAPA